MILKNDQHFGIEVKVVKAISQILNFTLEWVKNPLLYGTWGYKQNGQYTDPMRLLYRREADILFGAWHGNDTENSDFDGTFSYISDQVKWFAPSATPIEEWQNIVFVFSNKLWIYFGVTFLIFGFVWVYIEYKLFNHNPGELILYVFGMFLEDCPPSEKHMIQSFRILWVFFSFIITTAFQGKLVSVLTKPIYNSQIKSLEDALERKFKFGILPIGVTNLKTERTTISKRILENVVFCDTSMSCLNRLVTKRDIVVAKSARGGLYALQYNFKNYGGGKLGFKLAYNFVSYSMQMLVVKGFPIFERLNYILSVLVQSGIIGQWEEDYTLIDKMEVGNKLEVLSLEQLAIPFIFWIIGIILAIIAFVFEINHN